MKAQAHQSGSGSQIDLPELSDPVDRLHNQQGLLSETITEALADVQASLAALSARIDSLTEDVSQAETRAAGNTRQLAVEVAGLGGALAKRIRIVEALAAGHSGGTASATPVPTVIPLPARPHRQSRAAWIATAVTAVITAVIAAILAGLWLGPKPVPVPVLTPRPPAFARPVPAPVAPIDVAPVAHAVVHHTKKPHHKPVAHITRGVVTPSPPVTGFAAFGPADAAKSPPTSTTTPK